MILDPFFESTFEFSQSHATADRAGMTVVQGITSTWPARRLSLLLGALGDPVICFVIVFPFRAVVRSQSAKISSWLCSAHLAEALAQLLCERSRLLEGGEVVALP